MSLIKGPVITQTRVHISINSVYTGQQTVIECAVSVPWVGSAKTEFSMTPKIKIAPNRANQHLKKNC